MGSGGSKQADDPSQHVFSAATPVTFSQQVLDQLQNSPESQTDSTRARTLELQVQQRVQDELAKIRDIEASRLAHLTASLTPAEEPTPTVVSSDDSESESLGSRISSALTGSGSAEAEKTHNSVKAEIEKMKAKMEGRKKIEKPTAEVEKAKADLVQCLRMNDRRPLDCWKEVEEFKAQVGTLERAFVEKSLR